MVTRIPLPGNMIDTLMNGVKTGSGMYTGIMHPIIEREKQKQLEAHFQEQLKLNKAAAGRSGQAASDAHRIAMDKLDPTSQARRFEALENYFRSKGQLGGQQMPSNEQQMPTEEMGQGAGVFSPQGLGEAQQQVQSPQQSNQSLPGGLNDEHLNLMRQYPPLRGMYKKMYGIDPLAETPDKKRMADLQSKIDLENIKTDNKAKAIEQKELVAVKKDLPTLEKSLKGVDELMRIAKQNPDMFGHGFMPERFAKTTKIKDFGKWQNLISDAIAGLEQKLSARGNVVALKLASQLKPSHAEQQDVAIGKLESMRQQLIDSINNSKTKLGQNILKNESSSQYKDDDLVIVEGPNGDETMTYAQAKALGAQ